MRRTANLLGAGADVASLTGHPAVTHGGPVEAAFTPDARNLYMSNYAMYVRVTERFVVGDRSATS